jgi:hypothetical protein
MKESVEKESKKESNNLYFGHGKIFKYPISVSLIFTGLVIILIYFIVK